MSSIAAEGARAGACGATVSTVCLTPGSHTAAPATRAPSLETANCQLRSARARRCAPSARVVCWIPRWASLLSRDSSWPPGRGSVDPGLLLWLMEQTGMEELELAHLPYLHRLGAGIAAMANEPLAGALSDRRRPRHAVIDATGGGGAVTSTRTRASTINAPCGSAITGLQSSSAISACASTIALSRSNTSSIAPTS
jgi:hypothetical protein